MWGLWGSGASRVEFELLFKGGLAAGGEIEGPDGRAFMAGAGAPDGGLIAGVEGWDGIGFMAGAGGPHGGLIDGWYGRGSMGSSPAVQTARQKNFL